MKKQPFFKAIPSIESVERKMPPKKRPPSSRNLVCASCSSWIQFDSSGCTKSCTEMSRGACAFTFKGCRKAARLVGELSDLRQMMDSMKRMIMGQGLEEESGETGEETEEKREPVMAPGNSLTEESRKGKETAERSSPEDRGTDIGRESMVRKRRKLVDSCWMGRDYVQVLRCLQRTVTRRTRMVQWETSWIWRKEIR